jgi:hypothetical protein
MVADIINDTPTANFDTHLIEKRVLRRHAVAFAEELLEFRITDDPLMRFSAAFSQWLGRTFANEITKSPNNKVISVHLGGEEGENQEWAKMNPGTPIT